MLMDQMTERLVVSGILTTLTPIHIGSGEEALNPAQTDASVVLDASGKQYIPGSSMKGILRTRLESILRNEAVQEKWHVRACNVLDQEQGACITRARAAEIKKNISKKPMEMALQVYEESCNVCRLFGNQMMSSRVFIRDLTWISGGALELRNGVGIDRDTGTAMNGVKYDYFVVPSSSQFRFELVAENLEPMEQKLLQFLIDALKDGSIAIGAKTSRGLGKVQLQQVESIVQTPEDLLSKYLA